MAYAAFTVSAEMLAQFKKLLAESQREHKVSLGSVQVTGSSDRWLRVTSALAPLDLVQLATLAVDLPWQVTLSTSGSEEEDKIASASFTAKQPVECDDDDDSGHAAAADTQTWLLDDLTNDDRLRRIGRQLHFPPPSARPACFKRYIVATPVSQWIVYKLEPLKEKATIVLTRDMLEMVLRNSSVSQIHLFGSCLCIEIPNERRGSKRKRDTEDGVRGGEKRHKSDTL